MVDVSALRTSCVSVFSILPTVTACWLCSCQLQACSGRGQCVLGTTANLTTSCSCDAGYTGSTCDKSTASPWDKFRQWFSGPAWHVVIVAICGCLLLLVLCPLVVRCVLMRQKKAVELEEVVLGRLSHDWLINSDDLVYNIHKPIGAGGFAQVFKGSYNGVPVAVKVIHAYLLKTEERWAGDLRC